MGIKKTNEQFIKDCKNSRNDFEEYEFLEEYKGTNIPILIKHKKCNTVNKIRPSNFLFNKVTCKSCQLKEQSVKVKILGKNNKLTPEKYREKFYKEADNDYNLLSEYINSKVKIKVECRRCGRIYEILPTTFQSGYRCRTCTSSNRKNKRTHAQFLELAKLKRDDLNEYEFLSSYISSTKPIILKHICGRIYTLKKASNFLCGYRCQSCASVDSNSMKTIKKYLESKNITDLKLMNKTSQHLYYLKELQFENLKDQKNLRYDFGLFSNNNKLLGIIEFDGEQHYRAIRSEEKLEYTQIHDKLKTDYCIKNKIPLLRIPYYNFKSYKKIIDKFLISTTIENNNYYFKNLLNNNIMSRVDSEVNAESKYKLPSGKDIVSSL